jgi:drug/metabolite transporter (DMT)-like permease
MSVLQVLILVLYAVGMCAGQLLFKLSASRMPAGSLVDKLLYLVFNPAFAGAMVLYLVLSLVWVWILSFTPISRAYPFVTISIVLTPVIGAIWFHESLPPTFYIGMVLLFSGLVMITRVE